VLPWAIFAGAVRNLRIHFAQHVFLLREETFTALATDVVDGIATMLGGALGLWYGGLPGCVAGAAIGAMAGLLSALISGVLRHSFLFPLVDFLKITGAASVMVFALSFVPTRPSVTSIIWSITLGALVYGALLAALYPDRARSFWLKIKHLRPA